jgi:uncharacterized protein (DUF1697 family)
MLKYTLTHPEILHALASAGHGSQVLLAFADANYPFSTGARAAVPRVYLNLAATPSKGKKALGKTRRYAAFLRGVSPMNAKMPELKRCFEAAGFTDVVTVLSSGNVVFSALPASESVLEARAEAAMNAELGRTFMTIVRSVDALRRMIEADPFAAHRVPADAKRVVTFLRHRQKPKFELPHEVDRARILCLEDRELFSAYEPSPRGAVFMVLIEKTMGKEVTTRTWETVKKVAK